MKLHNDFKSYMARLARNTISSVILMVGMWGGASASQNGDCGSAEGKSEVRIDIVLSHGVVTARYRLNNPVSCLRLTNAGPLRSLTWKIRTDGVALDADGNTLIFDRPLRVFEVEFVTAVRDGQIDRMYTPIMVFGDGSAAAVYSKYLLPDYATGNTAIRFNGFSPLTPSQAVGGQTIHAKDPATYAVVGNPYLVHQGSATLVADRAAPFWLRQQVIAQIGLGEKHYARVASLPASISYLLTYTSPDSPGAAWRGDTLPSLVRLNFFGSQWKVENEILAQEVAGFVLHELFHTVNFQTRATTTGNGGLSLLEGGAEAAAATVLRRANGMSDGVFAAARDTALMRCLAINGDTLAAKETNDSRTAPYACGAALQYLSSLLFNGGNNEGGDLLDLWRDVFQRQHTAEYGWGEFFSTLRSRTEGESRARVDVLEDLVRSRTTWQRALLAFVFPLGLRPLISDELHQSPQSAFYAKLALFQILDSHCHGRRGMTQLDAAYILDAPGDSCSGLPDKFEVVTLNGQPLRDHGYEAYIEQVRRCEAGQPLEIMGSDGTRHVTNCSHPRANTPMLFSFDRRVGVTNLRKDRS